MKHTRFFLTLSGLCLLLGQFCPSGVSAGISETAFEEMLPEDTMFYLSVPDATELVAKFENSNVYKIIREIDPVALMSREPQFQRVKALYGNFVQPLTKIFQKRISLAVKNIPPAPGIPGAIFLADVAGREELLRQYLTEKIHPLLKQAGVPMLSFKHGDYEVQQISFAGPVPFAACYTIADSVFIATVGRQTMEELLDHPRREKSLADSELFQEVRRKVGENSDILAYANVSTLLETLLAAVPEEPAAWVRALGLTGVKAAGFGAQARGNALKQVFFLYTGPDRKGLLRLFAREPRPLKAVDYVPADATYFFSVCLGDFAQLWDEVMDTVRGAVSAAGDPRQSQRMAAALKQWEEKSGFRIKEDILSPFGGEVCIAAKVPEVMGVPPAFLFIEVKDAQKVKALVEKLVGAVQKAGGQVVKTDEKYSGVTITSFSLVPPGRGRGKTFFALGFMRPAFGIVGDFLVITVNSNLVKKIVDVHQGGKSLKDNPKFKRVMANLSEQGSKTSYLNMRELYDFLYGAFGGLAAAQIGPDLMAKLGKIAPYFGSSASRLSCDENGITYETFSESGGAEQVLMLPALAAFPVVRVSKAKGQAQRAACLNNLRQLALASIMYANDHDDVLPSSLSELYPNYLPDLNVFVCPVHKGKELSKKRIDEQSDYKLEIPGAKLGGIKNVGKTIMISEKQPNHQGGRNAAYADGHVQWVPGAGGEAARPGAVRSMNVGMSGLILLFLLLV